MQDREALSLAEYEFTAYVLKGTNMRTPTPCTYHLGWKIKNSEDIKEVIGDVHSTVEDNGDVLFNTQLKIKSKIVYNKQTKSYRPRKSILCVHYTSEGEADILGTITVNLSALVDAKESGSRFYPLERTSFKEACLQIAFRCDKVTDVSLEQFNLTATTSSRELSSEPKLDRTTENKKTPRSDLGSEQSVEVRAWTQTRPQRISILENGEDELVTAREDLEGTILQLKSQVEQLKNQLKMSGEQVQYQRQRNEILIRQFESTRVISRNNSISEKETNVQLNNQVLDMKSLLETQASRISALQSELENTGVLQQEIAKLQGQLREVKEFKILDSDKGELLEMMSRLQEEHLILKAKVTEEKSQSERVKQQLLESQKNYESILQENKYVLNALQKLSQEYKQSQRAAGDIRGEYEAYKLNKQKRRSAKDKAKMEKYERHHREMGAEVMRLNEELANFRQVQIRNKELKRQLDSIIQEVEDLKATGTDREKSRASCIPEDNDYTKELNMIINQLTLEQGNLNQKLVAFEKQNQQLRLAAPNIGVIKQFLQILQSRVNDDSSSQLLEAINFRRANLEELTSFIHSFKHKVSEASTELLRLKSSLIKSLPLEIKRQFLVNIKSLQQKMSQIVV